jgi:hypothetical protein
MFSASGEASRRIYKLLRGKSGKRWVVSTSPEAAEDVWVDGGKGSQGSAGRTLTFRLDNGETVDFVGPWKTGAGSLFEDTGYDVRGQEYSRSIVALSRENAKTFYGPSIYRDVLHYDLELILGNPVDPKALAQQYADEHGVMVYYAQTTKGGSIASRAEPNKQAARGSQQ